MSYVFISYSRKNRSIVSEVVRNLKSLNMELWLDTLGKSNGIPNSTKWFSVIEDALYRAGGAIIFASDTWEISKPCQDEYKLISQNNIPFIQIDLRKDQSIAQITDQISRWYQQSVDTEENYIRTDLSTRVRDYQQDKGAYRIFPPRQRLKQLELYALANNFDQNLEISAKISEYLHAASRSNRRKTMLRYAGSLITAILVILIYSGVIAVRALDLAEQKYLGLSSGATLINETMHVNPYFAMDRLISKTTTGDQAELSNCINLMVLNNLHLPIDYIPNADQNAEKYLKIKEKSRSNAPSGYSVLPSRTSGLVTLFDSNNQILKQIVIDGIVSDYCWNERSEAVALAVAEKAYVFDTDSSNSQPIILDGNFEDIASIGWDGNQVFAISTFGNIILWENPVRRPTNHRLLNEGKFVINTDGNLCAVYISGGNLIINHPQGEETIPLGVSGQINDGFIAVSHSNTQVAVIYEPTKQTGVHVLIIDLGARIIVADYPLECIPMEFIFSKDDKSILMACYDLKGIAKLDLTDGRVTFSNSVQEQYYSIAATEDKYLVSTMRGELLLYDKDLNVLGDGLFNSGSDGNIPRHLTVSEKYGYAYYTNFSGNKFGRTRRVTLSDRSLNYIFPTPTDDTESNSCVVVSGDGDFVAFGYPNGKISVYDVKNLTALWVSNTIQEKIIDLHFSSDNVQIFALGKSGTIYTLNTEGMTQLVRTNEELTSHWQRLVDKATAKNELAYNIGISNIPPQQFGLTVKK